MHINFPQSPESSHIHTLPCIQADTLAKSFISTMNENISRNLYTAFLHDLYAQVGADFRLGRLGIWHGQVGWVSWVNKNSACIPLQKCVTRSVDRSNCAVSV